MMHERQVTQAAADWYVLRCITGREGSAAEKVGEIIRDTWVPTYRTLTKPTKKRKPVEVRRPLVPGYILARVPQALWWRVAALDCVLGWVAGPGGLPAPVRPLRVGGDRTGGKSIPTRHVDEIAQMQRREELGIFDHDGLEGRLKDGDPLEVLFGTFAGHAVVFKAVVGTMIEGEVDMLGAPRRVRIPAINVDLTK